MGFINVQGFETGLPPDVPQDDVQDDVPEPGSYQEYLALTSVEDAQDRLRMTQTEAGDAVRVYLDSRHMPMPADQRPRLPEGCKPPARPNFRDHWLVGKRREAAPATGRHGYRERHAGGRREWWNRRAIDRNGQGR